ncbi:MAG: hypothetical protein ACAI35_28490 [Candidatus Methylacidiphilales bacterium]|nr:hypothetical protein [Candidatus Methylacidiphilales bacterium]
MHMTCPISDFAENFHLTYPHNNSFVDGGKAMILGRNTDEITSLWRVDPENSGKRVELCRFERAKQPEKLLWSDSALETDATVTIADRKMWLMDPHNPDPGNLRELYAAPEGKWLHPIPAISPDGRRAVCGLHSAEHYETVLIDVESGRSRILFEKPWTTDHFHFCPFDPEWIAFSHEGNCAKVMDRVWAWHETDASEGKCYFDQLSGDVATTLYVGHERWSFHDRSVMIVAYGDSPGTPRGIYEAYVDGRPQQLISEGDRDMHLDVSRDGKWVAIDTSGPHDLPGKGWENAQGISDILVAERATGRRQFLARTTISRHPSHPHPEFSPNGRFIYYNEGTPDASRNRVCRVENPFWS